MRGGQHQVLLLLQGLRNRGHASELLARPGSPLWNTAAEAGFLVRPASVRRVFEASRHADLIHTHDARAHALAALASQSRFVVSRRVAFSVRSGFASRWKYNRAARFLAVSKFVAGQLERAGVPSMKTDIVYDGVQLTSSPACRAKSDFLVVAPASRDPAKGRELVEQACALANVRVLFSNDLPIDLPRASLFTYITRSEGLGSAALLAMSFAVPVVASRVGGLPEIVTDFESGFLVKNDPQAIATAITKLKEDPELMQNLGRTGRARVEREFTEKHMVENTLQSYARALAN